MRRNRTIQWVVVGVLVVAAVVVVGWRITACNPSEAGDGGGEAPMVGYTAPAFSLATLDGGTVELSQLRDRWVLITFWTTWCPACVAQQPYLQAAYGELPGDIEFIGINLGESEERVRDHAAGEVDFTIALDTRQATGTAYNVRYLPTTLVIDPQGIIRDLKVGGFGSKGEVTSWVESVTSGGNAYTYNGG